MLDGSTWRLVDITLPDQTKAQAIASIRRYFAEQLDQEVGDLQASLLLEFVLKELGPSIYNAAVADAQAFLRDRVADLDGACFVPEFGYWPRSASRRPSR
jgi:uncharacterized protein (DUF2164 family)